MDRHRSLLRWPRDAFRRRAEASQQGIHRQRHRAEHGDLAERIECAEVDQHHVDHVAAATFRQCPLQEERSEEHTSELQSLMRISYAVFCLIKKKKIKHDSHKINDQSKQHKPNENYEEQII